MAIARVEEIRRSLLPDMASSASDDFLKELEAAIVQDAEVFTGRYIRYGDYSEIHSGGEFGKEIILLRGLKIWEVKKVIENGTSQSLSDYKLLDIMQGIYCVRNFSPGKWNIEIEYSAGYSANETGKEPPDGLKRAIIDEVVLRYDYLRGESRTGENIVDLKKNFLNGKAENYFKTLRRVCV